MDELSQKLSELLNDPEGLDQIKTLAESLLTDTESQNLSLSTPPKKDGVDIAAIMNILNALKNTNDKSVELLLALKPHLSATRQNKIDTAIKLLKIYSILPLLKDSGLLGELF